MLGKAPVNSIRLTMRDIAGSFLPVSLEDVPPVPECAVQFDYPDGERDTIFDTPSQRWRFRRGELVGYIVYGERQPNGHLPIQRLYCGNY